MDDKLGHFVFFVFSSDLLLCSHFFLSLSPAVDVTPIQGHLSRLLSPLPLTVRAYVFIARRLEPFLSSSTRIKVRLDPHAVRSSQQLNPLILSRAFHGTDHISRFRWCQGDPARAMRFENLLTRPDPTQPDPTRPDPTRPDPTRPDPTRPDPTCEISSTSRPEPAQPARFFNAV